MYKRAEYQIIKSRLEEPGKFIQVIMGVRQIGKSTVVKQFLIEIKYIRLEELITKAFIRWNYQIFVI